MCTRSPITDQIIIYCCICLFVFSSNAQSLVRGPYLQALTQSSVVVKWRTDLAIDSKLWYGTSPNNLNQTITAAGSFTDHEVLVNGLTAGGTYYYAIGSSSGQIAGADSSHYFVTAPASGSNQTVRAWVLGDAGKKNDDQRAVRDGYYNFIGHQHTDMVLLLGDNAYDDGTDAEFQLAMFENMYEEKLINTVWWPCPGNHDLESANSSTETGPYFEIFTCPVSGEAGGIPSGTENYYSFDYGNVHCVSLASQGVSRSPTGAMAQWLHSDLAANSLDWTVVFFHHPPYSTDASDNSSIDTDMREVFNPIFEQYGVDLVLGGHTHNYQRSFLINGHYGYSSTFDPDTHGVNMGDGRFDGDGPYVKSLTGAQAEKGTTYIVSGSAGSVSSGSVLHPVMYYLAPKLGSLYFEVTGNQMDVRFIDINGLNDDYFTIVKHDSIGSPPSINITSPLDDTYYGTPTAINIDANASDVDGTVDQVVFFSNGASIGIDHVAPYTLNWTIPQDGQYILTARATDNDGNVSSSLPIDISVGEITVSSIVSSSSDDVEERPSGSIKITSTDVDLINDGNYDQTIGLRFPNPEIPPGAIITNAYIQFTVNSLSAIDPCNLTIYGEAVDDALTFTSDLHNVTNRPRTAASTNWLPPTWSNIADAGLDQRTPNLAAMVKEIVDRSGYTDNSSLAFIIDGVGQRSAESYDGDTSLAPSLIVTYRLDCPLGSIGDPCDDGDSTTVNDTISSNCICAGTSIYDCPGLQANVGDPCDDGDLCTTGDTIQTDCSCSGAFADSDGDGVCDQDDICPGGNDTVDIDQDGVPDFCDICPGGNDTVDIDQDGVPDFCDICPGGNDTVDIDQDGVPDFCDICPGGNDTVDIDQDGVPDFCDICPGGNDTVDIDQDGVPDFCDICPGGNDTVDIDQDGVPDFCDICPGGNDTVDIDQDGVPDFCDICPGGNDTVDIDQDGVPDFCDICPGGNDTVDIDQDGVPDFCDICPGGNDTVDIDQDGVPDFCDICPGGNDTVDIDQDGVPDFCDICPGGNDTVDIDQDGVPDFCDICPGGNDTVDIDQDGVPDFCDICPGGNDTVDIDQDGVPNFCDICPGGNDTVDIDQDGVPDFCDICPGGNDTVDIDQDGVPDFCDICPGGNDTVDIDQDGVPDFCDICPGGNDTVDIDQDGVPDFCDICPGGNDTVDIDQDGVPDFCDICPGGNDTVDIDQDGVPDDCDNCIGQYGAACESGDCYINGEPITSGTYAGSIRVSSSGRVALDSSVIFEGGTEILLDPGFEIELGANFLGVIIECQELPAHLNQGSDEAADNLIIDQSKGNNKIGSQDIEPKENDKNEN